MSTKSSNVPKEHQVNRNGQWLPQDHRLHQSWLNGVVGHAGQNAKDLHPVLQEFKDMIERDTRLYLLFSSMLEQIPNKKPYNRDPTGKFHQMRDTNHLLQVINHLLTTAPHWNTKGETVGLVGLPINAVLDWPMGTHSGFALFLDPQVNAQIKKILNAWGEFLTSPASAASLGTTDDDWFGPTGLKELTKTANAGKTDYKFEQIFICDPSAEHHGFKSWDDFFTRLFRDGVRPVAGPDDDSIIANACESLTYMVKSDVKARDKFWVKGQPYSVVDMLAHDDLAVLFAGGTIYQAFLSALSYHRWHSPVSGKIVKAYVQDGTYYSEPAYEDADNGDGKGPDEMGESDGQGYLTSTATRAVMFIEADNKDIGLMACVFVGMAEVSTCDITVKEGQHVEKGQQVGMFHFGGSTHCLLFRKGVDVSGFPQPGREWNVPVRSQLAVVGSNKSS